MVSKLNAEVIGELANNFFFERHQIAELLKNEKSLVFDKRKVKTIATYYHSIYNGGIERVLVLLCRLWIEMGYNVVVFTDDLPTPEEYELPPNVERVVIPNYINVTDKNYIERAVSIQNLIEKYKVDAVVYHAYMADVMLWDEIVIKASGAAFIAYCHTIFAIQLVDICPDFKNFIDAYKFSDAIVTLSKTDKCFWDFYNSNVHVTTNPFFENPKKWAVEQKSSENHIILWCGRFATEKNPLDTIPIMKEVLKEVPDAVLHVLGSGIKKSFEKKFKKEIKHNHLEKNITLLGFHKDVKPFYQKAKIYLMTSSYEGYSLSLLDAKTAALPTVMYELPYLTLCEGERGIIQVPQKDTNAAAKAIIELLKNEEICQKYSKDARTHAEELGEFDFKQKWTEIFESLQTEHQNTTSKYEKIMLNTLISFDSEKINLKRFIKSKIPRKKILKIKSIIAKVKRK